MGQQLGSGGLGPYGGGRGGDTAGTTIGAGSPRLPILGGIRPIPRGGSGGGPIDTGGGPVGVPDPGPIKNPGEPFPEPIKGYTPPPASPMPMPPPFNPGPINDPGGPLSAPGGPVAEGGGYATPLPKLPPMLPPQGGTGPATSGRPNPIGGFAPPTKYPGPTAGYPEPVPGPGAGTHDGGGERPVAPPPMPPQQPTRHIRTMPQQGLNLGQMRKTIYSRPPATANK